MAPDPQFNPFPGLRAFEAEEDYLFFGRETQIDELLRRLRATRFLSVVGTSGSGKSSLIRAGLIPALEGGFMAQVGSGWRVAKFRPGGNPIGYLAEALSAPTVLGLSPELAETHGVLIEATLRRGARGLADAVRQAQIPPDDNVLVVVDQFEELFRFRHSNQQENSRDEAVAFVKLLLHATQEKLPIYIVITMRSDFIGDCMDFPGLPEAVNAGQYLVPKMTRDQLRSAIAGPVAVGGAQISPRLVLRLLNDVGDDHDQLPLLQHALMRTWEHWRHNRKADEPIELADYEAVGSMREALSMHAEQAYEDTVAQGTQHIAEHLFKALTDTYSDPRGVRRPQTLQELVDVCDASEAEIVQVIEVFRGPARSFLMPPPAVPVTPSTVIDISHESLMRCWTRLIRWADEESRSAVMYARIAQAAKWFEEGAAGLWRDPELEVGRRWRRDTHPTAAWARLYHENFDRAMQFLDRSAQERDRLLKAEERARKRKLREYQWAAGVLAGLLLIAAVLFHMARVQKALAEYYQQQAQNAVDEMLSSAGRREQARVAADVPEMEAFRKELLEKAKGFYATFEKREPNNNTIRAEMARAHFRLGEINRILDDDDVAIEQYELAIQGFNLLAGKYPGRADFRQWLANSYNWLGELLRLRRETRGKAEEAYNHALLLQEVLVRDNPTITYRRELARTYYNRGIVLYDNQQLDKSADDFSHAIETLKPLTAENAGPGVKQELARVYNDLGNLLRFQGKLSQAQPLLQQAVTIHEQLTQSYPENREYKFELATFYNNLALLCLDQKQLELARHRNRLALNLLEELAQPVPSLSMQLAAGHNLAAQLLENDGPTAVEEECERSQEILDTLARDPSVSDRPEIQNLYRDLGYNYLELAQMQFGASSPEKAQKTLQRCGRILPKVSDHDRGGLQEAYQRVLQALPSRIITHQ
jgi:tetratricopeptide (TPR) repeat protein/energy-coupling factor transporter ATP-binding protein EcfA2